MKVERLIAGFVVVLCAIAASSSRTAAQTEIIPGCTVKCGCISGGCGCQGSGGNGSECSASGNGCFVNECETEELAFLVGLGGAVVRLDVDEDATGAAKATPARASLWETVKPGVAFARSCKGMVVSAYFSPEAAQEVRAATKVLAATDD